MKVTDTLLASVATTKVGASEETDGHRPARTGEAGGAGADSVQLSALACKLARLAETGSPARAARLEQLTALVRSGEYNPDPRVVAAAIVNEALGPQS
ncbi:MAG: flagellar biosynthesis anti-sigma factor FlgM [bacterium]|jgi:flagellar biosynthesis anti-sigma factor FlgM